MLGTRIKKLFVQFNKFIGVVFLTFLLITTFILYGLQSAVFFCVSRFKGQD
jgi:hypothetical protein